MDAAFMMQVKDRVAKATEAVAASYDLTGYEDLPDLPPLPELLVELASEATHRCGECGAMLLEGLRSRICFACGEFQPAAGRAPEPFDFNTSLSLQLFFDSLKLDGTGLGIRKTAQRKSKQVSTQSFGQVNKKGAPENVSTDKTSKYFAEVEEDDIWESADGEGGAVNWTQELAEASAGDFFSAGLPPDNTSFYSTNHTIGQETTDDFADFFRAAPQPQSQDQSQQHNLDFFQSAPPSTAKPTLPVGDDGLFSLGTGSHAAVPTANSADPLQALPGNKSTDFPTKTSVLDQQGSSNDFFGQLEGLSLTRTQSLQGRADDTEPVAAVKSILNELPDLSFMLANRLVVPGGKKMMSMWSFKELA